MCLNVSTMVKAFLLGIFLAVCCFYPANAQVFKENCLKAHNRFRLQHGVPDMVLDDAVQRYALEWAQTLAKTGKFEHRINPIYGENIYAMRGEVAVTGFNATKAWYDEIKDYDWNSPGFSMATGHFTQVVWRDSVRLGCGIAKNGTYTVVVASYDPPGNFMGRFEENVPKRNTPYTG